MCGGRSSLMVTACVVVSTPPKPSRTVISTSHSPATSGSSR